MPTIEEVDSGIEAMSASTSRDSSPSLKKDENQIVSASGITQDDDEDIDETLGERIYALTEMFPESLRNFTYKVTTKSVNGLKTFYSCSRTVFWILFSSSALLVAPVVFEAERMQQEEATKQQQRQMLLGPSATVSSGGMHSMGMPMPVPRQ